MKVYIYTLGCKVNLYESEMMSNLLKKKDYIITENEKDADIYIINTCSVTNSADSKCMKTINKFIKYNENAIIAVAGCFSQANSEELKGNFNIDILIGTKNKSKIDKYIEEYIYTKNKIVAVSEVNHQDFEDMVIDNFENRKRAFIKIQDGCNNYCSYCIIPYLRGNIRSKDKNKVIDEITALVKRGYKEIVLTGIHTGSYGRDFKDYKLSDLLKEIIEIENLERIRISSIEITELDDELLNIIENSEKIVNHLHIPLQSGNDKILKLMNRKYDTNYFLKKINYIKSIKKDVSITTDVIVGFPQENDDDFNDTLKFVAEVGFSKIHVFPYSKRKNTKAASMPNQVNPDTKKERAKKLISTSDILTKKYINEFLDKTLSVLIEKKEDKYFVGHSTNYIQVKAIFDSNYKVNEIVNVEIIDIEENNCIGIIKNNNTDK